MTISVFPKMVNSPAKTTVVRLFQFRQLIPVLFFLLIPGLFLTFARAADQVVGPDRLQVDFTNNESRSISVRLGSVDGITADMDFAVLDSSGAQVAAFFPQEILNDRFWSGPLEADDYEKVASGAAVIRVTLSPEDAALLRERFAVRRAVLKRERLKRKVDDLRKDKDDLKERINEVKVDQVGLTNEIDSLRARLKREQDLAQRQVDDLQGRVDKLREERTDLQKDREDLLDRREDLLRRRDPPQERINGLNEDIADLDRDIGRINIRIDDLREEIRDLREEANRIQADIRDVQDEQRELDVRKRELETELTAVEKEISRLRESAGP